MQYAEHIETGKQLKQIRTLIMKNCKAKGKVRFKSSRALKLLDELRSVLDDIVFLEYAGKDSRELMDVYYGSETEL